MKNYLDKTSVKFRKTLFEIIQNCGRGHLGATLSLFEILRVLYMDICKINSKNYQNKDKDIIILSKGHGCLAQYIILEKQGILKKKDLNNFCKFNALLGGHTDHKVPGVRFSTGSLGHGISMGMGLALSK
jgi:transketolase